MKRKIVSISKLQEKLDLHRKDNKICLITGCFEILHIGHVELFQFAKDNSDIVVVGVEHDETIKLNKDRDPTFNQHDRMMALATLEFVDYIFPIDRFFLYSSKKIDEYHEKLIELIKPNHIATTSKCDPHWTNKEKRIKAIGGSLLKHMPERTYHSSDFLK